MRRLILNFIDWLQNINSTSVPIIAKENANTEQLTSQSAGLVSHKKFVRRES